jgi:hypothetical protein
VGCVVLLDLIEVGATPSRFPRSLFNFLEAWLHY